MDCQACREQFTPYCQNDLPRPTRRRFIEHLKTCTPCRSAYVDFERSLGNRPGSAPGAQGSPEAEPMRQEAALAVEDRETSSAERDAIFDFANALSLDPDDLDRDPPKRGFPVSALILGFVIGVTFLYLTQSFWVNDPTAGLQELNGQFLAPAEATARADAQAVFVNGSWTTQEKAFAWITGMTPAELEEIKEAAGPLDLQAELAALGYVSDGRRWIPAEDAARLEAGDILVGNRWISTEQFLDEQQFLAGLRNPAPGSTTLPVIAVRATPFSARWAELQFESLLRWDAAWVAPITGTPGDDPVMDSWLTPARINASFDTDATGADDCAAVLEEWIENHPDTVGFAYGAGDTVYGCEVFAGSSALRPWLPTLVSFVQRAAPLAVQGTPQLPDAETFSNGRLFPEGNDRFTVQTDAWTGAVTLRAGFRASLMHLPAWADTFTTGISNPQIVQFQQQIANGNAAERVAAIESLMSKETGATWFTGLLSDSSPRVRRAAARALVVANDLTDSPELATYLADTNDMVGLHWAVLAAVQSGETDGIAERLLRADIITFEVILRALAESARIARAESPRFVTDIREAMEHWSSAHQTALAAYPGGQGLQSAIQRFHAAWAE
jgi:hypothetical protein